MHHFITKKSGFIRCSALVIFWVSMSTSSNAFAECLQFSETVHGECIESDEGSAPQEAEYIPIIYSGAAVTLGAKSRVFGNIQSVAAVTLGAEAEVAGSVLAGAAVTVERAGEVTGDVTAGEAATLGANASVFGDLAARADVFIGAQSQISGDLTSSASVKLGAAAKVFGDTTAETSVTLGADAEAGNDGLASGIRAMTGSIILGEDALVKGDAKTGKIISFGMNSNVIGFETEYADPEDFINNANSPAATKTDVLTEKQKKLAETFAETYNELTTTIDTSRDFYPGIYHASALTTTAGITLTFVGSGNDAPDEWLINIDTYLSFGANVTIDLVGVAEGSTIVFNAGTYATVGANSVFKGIIFAGTYITTGANTTIAGVGSDCGGMFATNGAITFGARSTFGAVGCWQTGQTGQQNQEDDGYNNDDGYNDDGYYNDEEDNDEEDNDDEYVEDEAA